MAQDGGWLGGKSSKKQTLRPQTQKRLGRNKEDGRSELLQSSKGTRKRGQWKSTDSLFTDAAALDKTKPDCQEVRKSQSRKGALPYPFRDKSNNRQSEAHRHYPEQVVIKEDANHFAKLRQQIALLEAKAKQSYGLKFDLDRGRPEPQESESPFEELELIRSESVKEYHKPERRSYKHMVEQNTREDSSVPVSFLKVVRRHSAKYRVPQSVTASRYIRL